MRKYEFLNSWLFSRICVWGSGVKKLPPCSQTRIQHNRLLRSLFIPIQFDFQLVSLRKVSKVAVLSENSERVVKKTGLSLKLVGCEFVKGIFHLQSTPSLGRKQAHTAKGATHRSAVVASHGTASSVAVIFTAFVWIPLFD